MGSLDVRLSGIFNSNVLLHQGSMVQCIYVVEIYSVFCVFLQSGFLLGIPNRVAGMAWPPERIYEIHSSIES